jgi:type I restriction enzyme S subunit
VVDDETLVGMNVLGRLLMELREDVKQGDRERLSLVVPPDIPDFRLYSEPIATIEVRPAKSEAVARPYKVSDSGIGDYDHRVGTRPIQTGSVPAYLFEEKQQADSTASVGASFHTSVTKYELMRDSGLPWVGVVPKHWGLSPNRALIRKRKVLVGDRHTEYRLLSLTKQGIIVRDVESGKGKFSADMSTFQEVRKGDLVFCLFDVPETPRTVGLSNHDGMITGAYSVFECSNPTLSAFVDLFYRAMDDRKLLSPLYSGLRNTIPPTRFLGTKTPIPPPDEQAAIVRFLDHVNRRIERAIRAKRKVIALLNEQKQAIIHRAVTRGLDPKVRLKPSGILWLGDIPEHWTLKRFKFLATINSGQVDPRKPQFREMLLIAPNHIQSGSGKITYEETAFEQGADSGKYLVKEGQIIYSKIRPNLRKVTIAPRDCLCSADMYPISLKVSEISRDYFVLLLLSLPFTRYAVDCSMRVAMPKVNREALADAWFWYPEPEEQDEILEYVRSESQPFDAATNRTEREISLIREYQIRLITEVVTGKLDVREAARNLPTEIEEVDTVPELEEAEEEDMEELVSEEGGDD